jgi:hypothetical protein
MRRQKTSLPATGSLMSALLAFFAVSLPPCAARVCFFGRRQIGFCDQAHARSAIFYHLLIFRKVGVIGGLMTSTLVTLFILPVVYQWIEARQEFRIGEIMDWRAAFFREQNAQRDCFTLLIVEGGIYSENMRKFSPKTFFILALVSLQFIAPALNLATELPCDEKEVVACEPVSCCPPEPSPRMECCKHLAPKANASTPATLEQPSRVHLDLITPIQFVASHFDSALAASAGELPASFNSSLTGNQRYLLLATFLI